MQTLSSLNSIRRGKELMIQKVSFEKYSIEHSEMWMGAIVEVLHGMAGGNETYALRISIDNAVTHYIQPDESACKDDSFAHATWLYECRYLPVLSEGLKAKDSLVPGSVEEFLQFTNVLNCHFISGEVPHINVSKCLHEMIDRMMDLKLVSVAGEDQDKLRNGVTKLCDGLQERTHAHEMKPSSFVERDNLQQQGHAVMVIPACSLGCVSQRELERVMNAAAWTYLNEKAKRPY